MSAKRKEELGQLVGKLRSNCSQMLDSYGGGAPSLSLRGPSKPQGRPFPEYPRALSHRNLANTLAWRRQRAQTWTTARYGPTRAIA